VMRATLSDRTAGLGLPPVIRFWLRADVGRNYVVYVSPVSPPSTTNTVTVTGLAVGIISRRDLWFAASGEQCI
jgi:hypothetical protein